MSCKVGSARQSAWLSRGEECRTFVAVLAFALSATIPAEAQEPTPETAPFTVKSTPEKSGQESVKDGRDTSKSGSSSGSFVIAPIPMSSPAIGSGATILAGYIFPLCKSDKISPPSLVGGAWVGTDNGTRAWVAATELYFHEDRYHVISGVAHGDLNYDFYGTGTANGDAGQKFGLNQTADVFFGEALRRAFWQVFIGPRIWFANSRLEAQHMGETRSDLPPLGVDFSMRSLGFKIERETTPNRFYPEEGSSFQFGSDFFAKELGGTFTFQRYRMTFNSYHSLGTKQVLAYNAFVCSTGGDAPFFGQCIFGMQDELRGYPAGRYIDMKMLATQGEYRWALPWRLGVTAFGGLGEVAPTWGKFNADGILPSGGIGPRFMLSSKYHVNLRADFAWGKSGHTFSMGLGESF